MLYCMVAALGWVDISDSAWYYILRVNPFIPLPSGTWATCIKIPLQLSCLLHTLVYSSTGDHHRECFVVYEWHWCQPFLGPLDLLPTPHSPWGMTHTHTHHLTTICVTHPHLMNPHAFIHGCTHPCHTLHFHPCHMCPCTLPAPSSMAMHAHAMPEPLSKLCVTHTFCPWLHALVYTLPAP